VSDRRLIQVIRRPAPGTLARYRAERPSGAVRPRPAAWPAYSVTKAALSHLTRILDAELHPHGIRVNAVAP
jgi:NAD(P)-dependent dehydrogenase (short-subunit alcohol dehydrogenase family)